mgnify:CR=1 FL=1
MVNLKAYIPTCDRFINLIEANIVSLQRYFPEEIKITILGYSSPTFELPPNIDFVSLGEDRGPSFWSTDLRGYFESIEDDFFIYLNDDGVLVKQVDLEEIRKISEELDFNVGRLSLTHDLFTRPYKDVNDMVIESSQNANYRCSTQYSIWNRQYFLKYLQPGLTPWQFETKQSQKSKNDGFKILGLKNPIFHFLHLYQRGDYRKDWRVVSHNSKEKLDSELEKQISEIIERDKQIFK